MRTQIRKANLHTSLEKHTWRTTLKRKKHSLDGQREQETGQRAAEFVPSGAVSSLIGEVVGQDSVGVKPGIFFNFLPCSVLSLSTIQA